MSLREIAALFDREVLQGLKKEFGGLQTLLRNQHQVFQGSVCMCVKRKESKYQSRTLVLCVQQLVLV